MRVLVTGMNGQVGRALRAADWPVGTELAAVDRQVVDLLNDDAVHGLLDRLRPHVVVNAAAFTAVDGAEDAWEQADLANHRLPALLAAACQAQGAALIHLSTDYVFDGTKTGAWQEDDPVAPLNVYGRTKLDGEEAVRAATDRHVMLRTAWVHSEHGSNFVKTMLRVGAQRDTLQVVDDQVGCPTSAVDIARALVTVAGQLQADGGPYGTYHFCGRDAVSWNGFAHTIFDLAEMSWGRRPGVAKISSRDWPTRAARPANSVLDCRRIEAAFGVRAPDWRIELRRIVTTLLAHGHDIQADAPGGQA